MALTDKLTNIADAIRNKTNTTEPMTLDEMPTKIENIQTKSTLNLQNKEIIINENGTQTITADSGYDGLNNVSVTTNVAGSGSKYAPRAISFYNYSGTELEYELANLDTSRMTSMYYMFRNTKVTSLDVSNFDTSNVTNMGYTFYGCSNLMSLDLSNFDTSNVTTMDQMFRACRKLETLILGENFNFNSVTNTTDMFRDTLALTTMIIKSKTPLEFPDSSTPFLGSNFSSDYYGKLYVPDELVETYKTLPIWSSFNNIAGRVKPLSEYTG